MGDGLRQLLLDGWLVDVAIVVVALEAAALIAARTRTGRGLRPADVLGHLGAGALLLLALRLVLAGSDYRLVLLCLTASLPVHAYDLWRRARGAAATSP